MDNVSMSDLIAIVEGDLISSEVAKHRVMKSAKEANLDAKEVVRLVGNRGVFSEPHVDAKELKKQLGAVVTSMGGKGKLNIKGDSEEDEIEILAQKVKDAGMEDDVLATMDEMGMGDGETKLNKMGNIVGGAIKGVKGAAKGVASAGKFAHKFGSAVMGEGVLAESEVSDELVRTFFEKLITAFESDEAGGGLRESIVDDFLDTKLDVTKLKSIISIIDNNNASGAFSAVKDSILSKWGDKAIDTSTLRSINDELTTLSMKGIDF